MTVPSWVEGAGRVIGLFVYIVTGFFYVTSGLVVPLFPWLMILNAVWAFGLVVTIRQSRVRWWLAPLAVVGAVLFWVAYISAGEALLGWTA
jgi:hypothetical protein